MSTEFYGFVLYIAAFVGSVVWLAWAYIPDSALSYMGIIYYPAKYWAAATPAIIIVAYVSWFMLYSISVLVLCQGRLTAAGCQDSFSKPPPSCPATSLPYLHDMSIQTVNREINGH